MGCEELGFASDNLDRVASLYGVNSPLVPLPKALSTLPHSAEPLRMFSRLWENCRCSWGGGNPYQRLHKSWENCPCESSWTPGM